MRLELLPDRDGYSVRMSNTETVIENDLKGGPVAKRLDMLDVTYIVEVQFTTDVAKYDYLRGFLEDYFEAPEWFDILLVIEPYVADYPLRNYKAQIIPGSVKLPTFVGTKYVTSMQIECYLDPDELALTSTNYPVDNSDKMTVSFAMVSGEMKITEHIYSVPVENIGAVFSFVSGSLRSTFQLYGNWPAENIGATFSFVSGSMAVSLINYGNWPAENIGATFSFVSGSMAVSLINYGNWPAENIGTTFAFVSGSLT